MKQDVKSKYPKVQVGCLFSSQPIYLVGMDEEELVSLCEEMGEPPYRGRQIFSWLYDHGVSEFSPMTNIPKSFRSKLGRTARLETLELDRATKSADETEKYLWRLRDGARVESVRIPMRNVHGVKRWSLCISTQVGCAMGCAFCLTAKMGFVRQLTAGEIVGQFLAARSLLAEGERFHNVVFMGMGEPLDNFDATVKAVRILTHQRANGVSPRRLTVSTVGVASRLKDFVSAVPGVGLAVSLHAADDETRGKLVPVNRKWNLRALLDECRALPMDERRRITFEYVMLRGVNDSKGDARKLSRLLEGLKCKVNLIPWNPFPGVAFERPDDEHIEEFRQTLLSAGVFASTRISKGGDILAACGQLADARRLARGSAEKKFNSI
ncbi:MAG: 23S rRNA (adenine(2503)-C(2))-methyltransferase RlmN [Nitrospinae bacterium]|nr:23S rRNA (adenine(2503)-C(2))-methyltransferase RlmN [Nitrospinota bacterium]